MNNLRRLGSASVVALAALLSAGCSTGSLFDSDTPVSTSYILAPAPRAVLQIADTPIPADVSITRPDLAAGLDTDRIAVLEGRKLDYYKRVRWGARASELIQNLIVDSFEDQNLFRSVTADRTRVASDYVLDIQVRDFQAEYRDGERVANVHVAIVARLIRIVDRQLVTTLTADAQVAADDERMSAVAGAFESAAHRAILELARQAAAAISSDRTAP